MSESQKRKTAGAKKGAGRGFEDLMVFKRAYRASLELHRLRGGFPRSEQYPGGVSDQMCRASRSVCANIAEGFGRQAIVREVRGRESRQLRQFLSIAAGSADEVRVWLRYCLDLNLMKKAAWQKLSGEYREIARMLVALAKKLSPPPHARSAQKSDN